VTTRRIAALALISLALLAAGCSDGGNAPGSTDTPTPVSATPAASLTPPPNPAPTELPPILTTPATIDGCPLGDVALCALAIDVQQALNVGDLATFFAATAPQVRPCSQTSALTDDNIGCASPDDTSDPVLALFNFGSDCCYTTAQGFESALTQWLADTDSAETWRLYGLVPRALLTADVPAIVLVQGSDDAAPLLYVLTVDAPSGYAVPGVIKGALNQLYLRPDDELLPWP
jgi:hypothetical protein